MILFFYPVKDKISLTLSPTLKRFLALPAKKEPKKYTQTVNLPKTKFPLWINAEKKPESDSRILENCRFAELYSWQRDHMKDKEFVLHDGPPYANGIPHMGHAINKVLKDIINRHKLLEGYKVHYVPGWDCHGLPIELKAITGLNINKMTSLEVRERARKYATSAIADQKNVFKCWGIMADWNETCYHTFDRPYIKNLLRQFWRLYEKGLIYRELKPVYWSPSSKTALAEAELIYNEKHRSDSMTVRLRVSKLSPGLSCLEGKQLYLLVWTTTPWSLPGNTAVAVNPLLSYSVVSQGDSPALYLVASQLVDSLQEKLQKQLNIIASFPGTELEGCGYIGLTGEESPVVPGDHVTSSAGTGLVHTAPAHGHDDFLLAKKYNLPLKCVVDEKGLFTEEVDKELVGLEALKSSKEVIDLLGEKVVHTEKLTHSYPYDWRTNKPVIIRASDQWFINTERIKATAMNLLKDIEVVPKTTGGSTGLQYKLEKRPYWCISRQRVWGVPIPSLYLSNTPVITKELIEHYCDMIDKEGPDFWWNQPVDKLLPHHIAESLNIDIGSVEKGKDILDIWFDSGLSWSSVLEGRTAHLYLEGVDQFTGWFQSSLLTSAALQDRAPFKKLFVHGFAVDEKGHKMSKSVGNVIDPHDITHGTQDKKRKPLGVDVLRWWVSAHACQNSSVPVSETSLKNCTDSIYKIRSISKYLLGTLSDYSPEEKYRLHLLDHFVLHSLMDFHDQIKSSYESFQFNKVCSSIVNFITNDLSAFYCHLVKDRLYCEAPNDPGRRGAQYTLNQLLLGLVRSIAPVVPHLAEEIFSYHPLNADKANYFYGKFEKFDGSDLDSRYKVLPVMEQVLAVKAVAQKESPLNCNSWHLECHITAGPSVFPVLRILQKNEESEKSELSEILQMSKVVLKSEESCDSFNVTIKPTMKHVCNRCRKFTSVKKNTLCVRCQGVTSVIL